jgi:hypothetical protein
MSGSTTLEGKLNDYREKWSVSIHKTPFRYLSLRFVILVLFEKVLC